ncbi:MAG TPA: aminotransferase class I/II-fold pyridoxal phosphate-dependent enzyme [Paracoccaceae bacterium]|nr:aminotransferase class I/II-fold pyridoxal phosphate-dependent enzyme [Paracoccaceae bacterium]
MQFPQRFSALPEYAFPRLRALLDHHEAGGPVLHMSIGEPKHPFPDYVPGLIMRFADGFNQYPPNEGSPELRAAISAYISGRYGVATDPDTQIMALNGTREGLFNTCLALCPEEKNGAQPVVLLPNPFYQCYMVAAVTAGAEPVFVPAPQENGFLPDFASVPTELLDRTAVVYLCSPSNPQGAVASAEYWQDLLRLAEKHDFRVFADECYAEIYRGTPPYGALQAAQDVGADPERVVVFHSLSKRSNLPGMRSGFVASGPKNLVAIKRLRAYTGAPLPLPIQQVSAYVWADEDHAAANRARYAKKFDIADRILGDCAGYTSPQAGFFLWLNVGDGEKAALKLWRETGVRVLPGKYLSNTTDPRLGGGNPGAEFVRVALVAEEQDIERGLTAIRACLASELGGGE